MRIGFSAEDALVITYEQGIYFMEELKSLTDGEIDNIRKFIMRPGGINPITNVDKLGMQVSLRSENNLKLARFFLKHKVRSIRVAVETNTTLYSVHLLRKLKESEKEHKDHVVSLVIDALNWPKTMEILEEYRRGHIGVKGVPLFLWS